MGAGAPQQQGQSMPPPSAPGKGGMPGGAPTANPQTQAQYQQGVPQQPQSLGALQNAYSQFQNSAPPQPNSMFGQQPNPAAQAPYVSDVLGAYRNIDQQAPQTQPPSMVPPVPMGQPTQQRMPQAPNFGQMRQEDPRMRAMRHMQMMNLRK